MHDILLHFDPKHGWQPQILDNGCIVAIGHYHRYFEDAPEEGIKLLGQLKFESLNKENQ